MLFIKFNLSGADKNWHDPNGYHLTGYPSISNVVSAGGTYISGDIHGIKNTIFFIPRLLSKPF